MKNWKVTIFRAVEKRDMGTWVSEVSATAIGIVTMSFETEEEAAAIFESLEIEEEGVTANLHYAKGETAKVIKRKGNGIEL